jgi:ABC-type antimicrobial peptide transport system permease subunit
LVTKKLSKSDAEIVACVTPRMAAGLLGIFGSLALLLASAGLYGAMAYSVKQREKEMGVRMALGASARSIIATVLRQGFRPVFWGFGAGLLGFVVISCVILRLLFGIGPLDAVSLGAGVLSLSPSPLLPATFQR